MKWKEKVKEKKVWMSGLGFIVALGLLSASQTEKVKQIFHIITGG